MVVGKKKGNIYQNKKLVELRRIDSKAYCTVGSGTAKFDKGDIVFLNYLLECKHHKHFSINELYKFLKKIELEASERNNNLIPILLFKINYMQDIIMYRENGKIKMEFYKTWLENLRCK